MSEYLLDTGLLILAVRRDLHALDWLDAARSVHRLYISVASRAEVLAGMHAREERMTMTLLDSLTAIPISSPIADQAGRLMYAHARQGRQVSLPDAFIAATVLTHGLILVTTNVKHFLPLLGGRAIAFHDS